MFDPDKIQATRKHRNEMRMKKVMRLTIWLLLAAVVATPLSAQQEGSQSEKMTRTFSGVVQAARSWAVTKPGLPVLLTGFRN
jgi:hypothetical protein